MWHEENALLLSDVHLGKVSHFRKAGIALPVHAEHENLERLSTLILNNSVDRVIILGDLFHSVYNNAWLLFERFLSHFKTIQFDLVMGNHDILESNNYQMDNLNILGEHLQMGPFFLTHHPTDNDRLYNICGHIHPAVYLRGQARQGMKLPCFYFSENQAILPAFGSFTGSAKVKPTEKDDIFAIADRTIFKVL